MRKKGGWVVEFSGRQTEGIGNVKPERALLAHRRSSSGARRINDVHHLIVLTNLLNEMPLQNRVTPCSTILAIPEHGMFMGNRGCLHNEDRAIIRQTCSEQRWIICKVDFNGRRRTLMSPGKYTELFFLDEATALAAGHRPCAECRRENYRAFKGAWIEGNPNSGLSQCSSITEIDKILHQERLTQAGKQLTYRGNLSDLPNGAMVVPNGTEEPCLWNQQGLYRWTPGGYEAHSTVAQDEEVMVLTPRSVINAIKCGFTPVFHPSVER